MAVEIERKFLVQPALLPPLPPPLRIEQGYLCTKPTVRVRLIEGTSGARSGRLTIKGSGLVSRPEFEYEVPESDAEELLRLCARSLRKQRHRLGRWEIDRFEGIEAPDGGPLWLAEIELASEEEPFERPAWLGPEVTYDPRYANSALARPR
jgi:CYTH domain-containing protein